MRIHRSSLAYGLLRPEPAITSLDYAFRPCPRSGKRIARQNSFRPPCPFRDTSPCPGQDRLVSGRQQVTPGPFKTPVLALRLRFKHPSHDGRNRRYRVSKMCSERCDHVGFPSQQRLTRLCSPLAATPWPVFQDGYCDSSPLPSYLALAGVFLGGVSALPNRSRRLPRGFMHFSPPFRDTFHLSLTLLMRYRSREVFRFAGRYPANWDA